MHNPESLWKRLHQAVTALLLLSFILNAFPHVNTIKDSAFYLAVLGFLFLSFKKTIRTDLISPLSLPLALLLVWAFITTVTANEISDSLDSLLSHLLKYLLLLVVTVNVLDSPRKIVWLTSTFIISTLLFCLGAVIYFYVFQSNPWSTRLGFDAAAHNIICFGANLAVIFSFYELKSTGRTYGKPLIFAAMMVFIATTFLTQSRGGILALGTSVFILIVLEKKFKILVPISFIIGLGLMVSPVMDRFLAKESFSNTHRMGAIYYYLEVFKDHPLKGIGFAIDIFENEKVYANDTYFQKIPEEYREDRFTVLPHSMFLSILVRMGVVGCGLYLYLLAVYFSMGLKTYLHGASNQSKALASTLVAAMVMFLVGGLFEPVFIHQLDTIFFALLAINIVLWKSALKNVDCRGGSIRSA